MLIYTIKTKEQLKDFNLTKTLSLCPNRFLSEIIKEINQITRPNYIKKHVDLNIQNLT